MILLKNHPRLRHFQTISIGKMVNEVACDGLANHLTSDSWSMAVNQTEAIVAITYG
jgi:hypothetical protein